MKLMEEVVSFANWVFPNDATNRADYSEYKAKESHKWQGRAQSMGFRFPIFDTYEDFVSSLRAAPVTVLTSEMDNHITNRSQTSSLDQLKSLVSGYANFAAPPRDVDRIANGYETNAPMPMPIILKGSKGMWIMTGNTRLDAAFILGVTPKILLVDVSDK